MNKKSIVIILVLLIIICLGIGFLLYKIKENGLNYELAKVSEYKYVVIKSEDKYGVMTVSGEIIIEPTYDLVEIPNQEYAIFICYQGNTIKAYNENKNQLYTEYNSVSTVELNNIAYDLPFEKSVLKSEKNGKYGLIDFDGNIILDVEYDSIESFDNVEGQFIIEKDGKFGIANLKGTIIIEPQYDYIISDNYYTENDEYKFSGYIVGMKNSDGIKYGYINYKGDLKLELEYNNISRIVEIQDNKNAYLICAQNGQYGVMKNGKEIIANEYQNIEYDSNNNIFIVQRGEEYGVIDFEGNNLIDVEYTSVLSKGDYIYVEDNEEKLVYDIYGNIVDMDFNQVVINTENENYKIIIKNDESNIYYGVLDSNNNEIISAKYSYIEYAYGNYFIASNEDGLLGVLDSDENNVIEFKYDLIQKIKNKEILQTGFSETNTIELYSYSMEKIATMENATIDIQDEYIKLYSDIELKYYNNVGEEISAQEIFTTNQIFADVKDGKWGFVNSSGQVVVDYIYDMVTEVNSYGFASIKLDGKWGSVDKNGNIVIEPTYERDESYGMLDFISDYVKIQTGFGEVYYTKDI